jgi:phosphoglycolate phosphatase
MVGDSINDIGAARAAKVPVIGVTFGYTDVPVVDLGPDRIVDRYERLPGAVLDLAAENADNSYDFG